MQILKHKQFTTKAISLFAIGMILTFTAKAQHSDTSNWSLKLVAGSNFDFFNTSPKFQNFAGELNLAVPNFHGKWGVNFSLFNYHYTQSDSSSSFHSSDYYFLNPQDYYNKADSTGKIVKRSYSVNRKADNNIWGAFIEPIYELFDDDNAQLYCSLHIEGVLTTVTYTPTYNYTNKDTVAANLLTPAQRGSALAHPAIPDTYSQGTFYDVYLGAGLPLKVNVANQFHVSVTSTAGVAFIQQNFPPSNLDYQERFSYSNPTLNKIFFLTKFQLVSNVAAVDVAIGGEYRVVIGNLHYLTTYVAASIPLDKLLKK